MQYQKEENKGVKQMIDIIFPRNAKPAIIWF